MKYYKYLTLLALLLPSLAFAAPIYDSTATNYANPQGFSLSASITMAGSGECVVVYSIGQYQPSSVTVGGVSGSLVGAQAGASYNLWVYTVPNVPSGAQTMTENFSTSGGYGGIWGFSFSSCDSTTPFVAYGDHQNASSVSTDSLTITTTQAGTQVAFGFQPVGQTDNSNGTFLFHDAGLTNGSWSALAASVGANTSSFVTHNGSSQSGWQEVGIVIVTTNSSGGGGGGTTTPAVTTGLSAAWLTTLLAWFESLGITFLVVGVIYVFIICVRMLFDLH